MSEPQPYQWDYDRSNCDSSPFYTTFSVGVYQWVPKADGKGLKKSKTIRIMGYVADPDRVYDMAQQLCDRLNEAGARADNPPAWLQKQYSVPKPFGLIVERSSDDLTSAQVRAIRSRVMKRLLAPKGFVRGDGGTYVRRRADQIQLINFQASRYGHEYTVNLGFHYAFVLPFYHRVTIPLVEFDLLDCAVMSRIGDFSPGGRDTWYSYGNDRQALQETLAKNARDCLTVFEEVSQKWADPELWITSLTSNDIRPWRSSWDNRFLLFVAYIAIHLGQLRVAEERLRDLLRQEAPPFYKQWYESLLKEVEQKSKHS